MFEFGLFFYVPQQHSPTPPPQVYEMQNLPKKDFDYYLVSNQQFRKVQLYSAEELNRKSQNSNYSKVFNEQEQDYSYQKNLGYKYPQSDIQGSEVRQRNNEQLHGSQTLPNFKNKEQFSQQDERWFENYYGLQQIQLQIGNTKSITHKIGIDDTLEGLALQYGVSKEDIITFNQLSTTDIYYKKEINIPNPKQENLKKDYHINEESYKNYLKIEQFMLKILSEKDRSVKVAETYLNLNNWDLKQAILEYEQDRDYEMKNQFSTRSNIL